MSLNIPRQCALQASGNNNAAGGKVQERRGCIQGRISCACRL